MGRHAGSCSGEQGSGREGASQYPGEEYKANSDAWTRRVVCTSLPVVHHVIPEMGYTRRLELLNDRFDETRV
jgi:hypothetical protein